MSVAILKPQPRVTALSRPFWDGCNANTLVIQRCRSCTRAVFYPRVCCPFCKGPDLDWFEASGTGSVITHTTVRRTHHDGFNAEAPYVFAAIELAEGPLFYATLIGAPIDGPSLIGRAVKARFVDHGPGRKLCAFELT
jgi:uncharacterized OB-fold protein